MTFTGTFTFLQNVTHSLLHVTKFPRTAVNDFQNMWLGSVQRDCLAKSNIAWLCGKESSGGIPSVIALYTQWTKKRQKAQYIHSYMYIFVSNENVNQMKHRMRHPNCNKLNPLRVYRMIRTITENKLKVSNLYGTRIIYLYLISSYVIYIKIQMQKLNSSKKTINMKPS